MKHPLSRATIVAVLTIVAGSLFVAQPAQAQQRQPASVQSSVRIIDLKYIFEHHERFKAETGRLRVEVQAREGELKTMRDRMKSLADRKPDFQPGSPEYKNLEADLVRMEQEMRTKLALGKKEFLEKEAKIYFNVYREVLDEVKYYCDSRGVAVVLRFNGDTVDPNADPQAVLKELNKSVVYYNPSIDITPVILGELNRRFGGGRAAAPGVSSKPSVPLPRNR